MRAAIGFVLLLAGLVWVAQGLNLPFAPGSFMTADPLWAAIGAATAVVGLAVLASGLRRRDGDGKDAD